MSLEEYLNAQGITILRSINVDGHEVVWAETKNGTHVLFCECDQSKRRDEARYCHYREAACCLRQLELQAEYRERFGVAGDPRHKIRAVLLDMIERAEQGEFIGEPMRNYLLAESVLRLRTVAAVLDLAVEHLHENFAKYAIGRRLGWDNKIVIGVNRRQTVSA